MAKQPILDALMPKLEEKFAAKFAVQKLAVKNRGLIDMGRNASMGGRDIVDTRRHHCHTQAAAMRLRAAAVLIAPRIPFRDA